MSSSQTKIIFYELNEVPWQVVDYFVQDHPRSTLGAILQNSYQYTTRTYDSGELHPWSTWPTVHRGVYNDTHGIRFLNQKIETSHPALYELLIQADKLVGVFGSLQSWPIPEKKQNYSFYVPDTFAQTSETLPSTLRTFQKFNLDRTKKDGGAKPEKISLSWSLVRDVFSLFDQGLSIKTVVLLLGQLLKERLNPAYYNIRSIFQACLSFDLYEHLLKSTHPDFSCYFTNHVAGMMHRYWKYAFPYEFFYTLDGDEDHFSARHILRAMKIADDHLASLKEFADAHGYILMIASSMGQEAIQRDAYCGELRITDIQEFLRGIGYDGRVSHNLAMQPDFSFSFQSEEDRIHFGKLISALKTPEGISLFTLKEALTTLNCNLQTSPDVLEKKLIYKGTLPLSIDHFGVSIIRREPGTGYHQPKGIWIIYKKDLTPYPYRDTVESIEIAPTILNLFEVKKPPYMKKGLTLSFDSAVGPKERAPECEGA